MRKTDLTYGISGPRSSTVVSLDKTFKFNGSFIGKATACVRRWCGRALPVFAIAVLIGCVVDVQAAAPAMKKGQNQGGGNRSGQRYVRPVAPATAPAAAAPAAATAGPGESASSKSTSTKSLEPIAKAFVDALNQGDQDALKGLLTEKSKANFDDALFKKANPDGFELGKLSRENEVAKAQIIAKRSGQPDLLSQVQFRKESNQWRGHAVEFLGPNDQPLARINLEKPLEPQLSGELKKMLGIKGSLTAKTTKTDTASGSESGAAGTAAKENTEEKTAPAPEPIVALELGGRKNPANLDFMQITQTDGVRMVKAKIQNNANKAIRRLDVTLYFLDAGSTVLNNSDTFKLQSDPPIVAARAMGEVEFKAVGLSEAMATATKQVLFEITKAQFTDGTQWVKGQNTATP